jgi:hypothetical protein
VKIFIVYLFEVRFLFLLRQRSRAEASEQGVQLPQKWQPSQENPDGKIVQVAKPPPTSQFHFCSNKNI